MRQGLSYFHSTIFNSLPTFYRRIDTALKQVPFLQSHLSTSFLKTVRQLVYQPTCMHASTAMAGHPAIKRWTRGWGWANSLGDAQF